MGRPEGTHETPERILQKEMLAWAKTARTIREMVDEELKQLQITLKDGGLTLTTRLEILSGLREVLLTSTRVLEGGQKLRLAEPATAGGALDDTRAIEAELMK